MLIRYGNDPQLQNTPLGCNTPEAGLFSNVAHACTLGLPVIADEVPAHGIPAVICGGGPSLAGTLESIHARQARGAKVFALNNTAQFLAEHGIRADYQVILDPRAYNTAFIEKPWADELLLCSQVHPEVFAKAKAIGYPVRLWHPGVESLRAAIPDKNPLLVSVTLTVGLSVLSLVHVFGHREFHLYGYDSCHAQGKSHAYAQNINAGDELVRVCVDSQVFTSSMAMAGQAAQFKQLYDMLRNEGTTVYVHGEGLIPAMYRAWKRGEEERTLTAVYDLGLSPPTYDFLTFLVEAERHRRANGYTWIDLVIQPGPMHGFRDDDLPPDTATRDDMLWTVVVPMARLLPSVRNVNVYRARMHTPAEDVFPLGYKEDAPLAHYGVAYLHGGEPLLRATEFARRRAAAVTQGRRYATITLREAPYWPERNSNRAAWLEAAHWLRAHGVEPIFVPDANTHCELPGFTVCEAAAHDIDMRAALYEGAAVNCGVLNGPMSLPAYLDCRYLIVKVIVESAVASTRKFLASHGYEEGDDFGGNGRMVWRDDSAANIIAALEEEFHPRISKGEPSCQAA